MAFMYERARRFTPAEIEIDLTDSHLKGVSTCRLNGVVTCVSFDLTDNLIITVLIFLAALGIFIWYLIEPIVTTQRLGPTVLKAMLALVLKPNLQAFRLLEVVINQLLGLLLGVWRRSIPWFAGHINLARNLSWACAIRYTKRCRFDFRPPAIILIV